MKVEQKVITAIRDYNKQQDLLKLARQNLNHQEAADSQATKELCRQIHNAGGKSVIFNGKIYIDAGNISDGIYKLTVEDNHFLVLEATDV